MNATLNPKPRLCVVGPLVGRNPGRVTTPGETLAARFSTAGYCVTATSSAANRYVRLIEIVGTLMRSRQVIDTVLLQVYGGRSFVVEDSASALASRCGHRIVMHLHGGAMPAFMTRFPRWTRRVLSRADAIVVPSSFLARAVERYGWVARTIPNGIDVSAYAFRRRGPVSPRLFWMRSFNAAYNPMMAVRVLARVRSSLPAATLVMGGQDDGLQGSVRAAAVRLGVQGAVRFVGFLDPAGKEREGAAAETGLLVRDDDVEAMSAAVERLVRDPALAGHLSITGRREAERCSWTQVLPQWERLFEQLTPHPRSSRQPRGNGC